MYLDVRTAHACRKRERKANVAWGGEVLLLTLFQTHDFQAELCCTNDTPPPPAVDMVSIPDGKFQLAMGTQVST